MYFKFLVFSSLIALSFAQCCCPPCGGCGCAPPSPQCLPAASPYEAVNIALALPGPPVPQPCIPQIAAPVQLLPGCGPPPSPIQIIQVPSVIVPGPCTPVIELPTPCLPPPTLLAHRAVVRKAVLKPQVYQRLIKVPILARFLRKSVGNVVDNIVYTANPKCCGPEAPVPMVCANPPPCSACAAPCC